MRSWGVTLLVERNAGKETGTKEKEEKVAVIVFFFVLLHAEACETRLHLSNWSELHCIRFARALAKDKTTKVRMNRRETTYNALNVRGLQEITPPLFVEIM